MKAKNTKKNNNIFPLPTLDTFPFPTLELSPKFVTQEASVMNARELCTYLANTFYWTFAFPAFLRLLDKFDDDIQLNLLFKKKIDLNLKSTV